MNNVSSWCSLHICIEMHGQQNIKKLTSSYVTYVILDIFTPIFGKKISVWLNNICLQVLQPKVLKYYD